MSPTVELVAGLLASEAMTDKRVAPSHSQNERKKQNQKTKRYHPGATKALLQLGLYDISGAPTDENGARNREGEDGSTWIADTRTSI